MRRPIVFSIWFIILLPLMFIAPHEEAHIITYLLKLVLPASIVMVFWANYLWLLPRYHRRKDWWQIVLCNAVIMVSCVVILSFVHTIEYKNTRGFREEAFLKEHPEMVERQRRSEVMDGLGRRDVPSVHDIGFPHDNPPAKVLPHVPPRHGAEEQFDYFSIFIAMKDVLYLLLGFFVAFFILAKRRMSRLQKEKQEAEAARQEAELCGLRNQVSPHFLLNTLNGIYSLSLVGDERTSDAIIRLSRLLHHILYDSRNESVNLYSESEFVRAYVELMRLRLTDNVKVNLSLSVSPDSRACVAPFIIPCLLENAFKHGTDSDTPCHIDISISETDVIRVYMCNSNRPRSAEDRSGHGIGLELVHKRLEFAYHGQYEWNYGVQGDNWITELIIKKSL